MERRIDEVEDFDEKVTPSVEFFLLVCQRSRVVDEDQVDGMFFRDKELQQRSESVIK